MANFQELKDSIKDVIKANGNQEITGQIMQNVLLSIINNVGTYATYVGIATPTTNPGTPDGNVFYITATPGNYVNFGNLILEKGKAYIIKNGENNEWEAAEMPIPSNDALIDISNVKLDSDAIIERINYLDISRFTENKYLSDSDGSIINHQYTPTKRSAIAMGIPVEPNTVYKAFATSGGGLYSIWQYDRYGNAIGKVSKQKKLQQKQTNIHSFFVRLVQVGTRIYLKKPHYTKSRI